MTKFEKAKIVGLSLVASAIVATSGSAGMTSLDVNKTYNVAVAKAAASAVNLPYTHIATAIKLKGVSTSTTNGTIKFAVANGELNTSDYNLSKSSTCDATAANIVSGPVVVPNRTTELFFTLSSQVTNQDLYLCNKDGLRIDFNMTKGLAVGAKTTLTVTLNDGIETKAYPAATLAEVVNNFTAANKTNASNTINVNEGRKKFVTGLTTTGNAELNVTKGGDTTPDMQATITNLRATLTGDFEGVTSINFPVSGVHTVTAAEKTAGKVVKAITTSENNLSAIAINVDASTVLLTRTIAGVIEASTDGGTTYVAPTAPANTDLFTWTINGYQGNVPYLSVNTETTNYIKLNNNHTVDAIVTFDATDDAGTKITNLTVNKSGKTTSGLVAGEAGLWNAADIRNAARTSGQTGAATFAEDGKFRLTATVTAPTSTVYGVAIQQIGGARDRMIPIFTSTVDNTGAATYMQH